VRIEATVVIARPLEEVGPPHRMRLREEADDGVLATLKGALEAGL
jgi:hypothetical protein